jgi:hypothetical protein
MSWAGRPASPYDRCYDVDCDRIDNVNRDVLNHDLRALADTLAHLATSADELRCLDGRCSVGDDAHRLALRS